MSLAASHLPETSITRIGALGTLPDVYSVREVARAASVRVWDVQSLVESGQVAQINGFLPEAEAIRALRFLSGADGETSRRQPLFHPRQRSSRPALPFAAATALHAAIVATIVLLGLGLKDTITEAKIAREPARLVFLAVPGPGGGGGGGGLRRPEPPARAELKGKSVLRSPVRVNPAPRRATVQPRQEPPPRPDPRPVEKPAEPVPQATPPVPPVAAPVVAAPAESRDQAGVPEAPSAAPPSQGSGAGGGTGAGQGSGMGEGKGPGIGDGEGGGTGGGPYRPGSGITPPGLLREVKPQYTEDARRLGVEGDVVLEIVVKADGTVGNVRLMQRLGSGLDQRAVDAVRQWRFSPARRYGTPVDVLVEVAVEFKLR